MSNEKVYDQQFLQALIEAKSRKLSEVVSAARAPMMLVLLWAFVWLWGLVITSYSGMKDISNNHTTRLIAAHSDKDNKAFVDYCKNRWLIEIDEKDHRPLAASPVSDGQKKAVAAHKQQACHAGVVAQVASGPLRSASSSAKAASSPEIKQSNLSTECKVKSNHSTSNQQKQEGSQNALPAIDREHGKYGVCLRKLEEMDKALMQEVVGQYFIVPPGGLAKTFVNDWGIMAGIGMLLLHAWLFFAARREYHSIQQFVHVNERTREVGRIFPNQYWLTPAEKMFQVRHLAYAYHAVTQRFIFIFSSHSRPLQIIVSLLLWFPWLLFLFNFYGDVNAVMGDTTGSFGPQTRFNVVFEFFLLMVDAFASYWIWYCFMRTSMLMNGWQLAYNYVWNSQLDNEGYELDAKPVLIDYDEQRAYRSHADRDIQYS